MRDTLFKLCELRQTARGHTSRTEVRGNGAPATDEWARKEKARTWNVTCFLYYDVTFYLRGYAAPGTFQGLFVVVDSSSSAPRVHTTLNRDIDFDF